MIHGSACKSMWTAQTFNQCRWVTTQKKEGEREEAEEEKGGMEA